MEKIDLLLKECGKNERFVKLVKKIFQDYNINEEKGIIILERIYK